MSRVKSKYYKLLENYAKKNTISLSLVHKKYLIGTNYNVIFINDTIIRIVSPIVNYDKYYKIYSLNQLIIILSQHDFKQLGTCKYQFDLSKWECITNISTISTTKKINVNYVYI